MRLVEFKVGPLAPGAKINLADALVAPDVLRPYLTNWPDVVRYFIRSVGPTARVLRAWAKPKRARARQSGPRSGQPQIGQL